MRVGLHPSDDGLDAVTWEERTSSASSQTTSSVKDAPARCQVSPSSLLVRSLWPRCQPIRLRPSSVGCGFRSSWLIASDPSSDGDIPDFSFYNPFFYSRYVLYGSRPNGTLLKSTNERILCVMFGWWLVRNAVLLIIGYIHSNVVWVARVTSTW